MGGGGGSDPRTSARDRIYRSAARLYALHGFEGTSIRKIAEAAGVTKPLIYYHFESKEKLFSSLLDAALNRCLGDAREIAGLKESAARKVQLLVEALAAEARRAPEVTCFAQETLTMPVHLPLAFDYQARGREYFDLIAGVIEDGRCRGEFRDVDSRHVAAVIVAAIGFFAAVVLAGELEEVPEDLGAFLSDLLLRGLEAGA
jgi:AcrR family transcriptional regulator